LAGKQADTDPLTNFPPGYSVAQGFNAANCFVPRNARQGETWVDARDRGRIGVADAAGFDPDSDLSRGGDRERALDQIKNAGRGYFNRFVGVCHLSSPDECLSTNQGPHTKRTIS